MSNPAVVNLQKKWISGHRVWLDDNFGEAIHIHLDNIRVDLSNEEFEQMCSDVCDTINELIEVEGFNCHLINPVYLEVMLWENLINLYKVKIDEVRLSDLYAPGCKKIVKLEKSRGVRALRGDPKENDEIRVSHHMGQTSRNRLYTVYESIKNNGYPYNGEYIILYGEDNVIRDGQHRASCLWHLYGDISIPVMRLYFKDYQEVNVEQYNSMFHRLRMRCNNYWKTLKDPKKLYKIGSKLKNNHVDKVKMKKKRQYIESNRESIEQINIIFETK